MRVIAIGLCASFAAVSSPVAGHGAPQEPTLFPLEKSQFSQLFKVPPPAPPKTPQTFRFEVHPLGQEVHVVPGEIRTSHARVECGIKVIEGDPSVDPKMVIPIPEQGQKAKIRVIAAPPCVGRR